MFALVTKTTDCSSVASTTSCSARGNRPRTIGSTFARVSAKMSASGSGSWVSPSVSRLTSRTSASRRSSWARFARSMKPPDQAECSGIALAGAEVPLDLVGNGGLGPCHVGTLATHAAAVCEELVVHRARRVLGLGCGGAFIFAKLAQGRITARPTHARFQIARDASSSPD